MAKNPMSLWDGDRKVEQFSASDSHTSREAKFGVWIKNGRVYKLFGTEDQANRVGQRTNQAIAAGVPTPAMTVLACTWIDQKGKANKVWAGITEQLSGRKFQLSKSGQLTMIEKEIKKADNRGVWQQTLQGLTAAVAFKLTDAQGFFNAAHNPPLSFIDIHYGSTAAGQLSDLRDFVAKLLN